MVNSVYLIEIENVICRVYQWIVDITLHCHDSRLLVFTSRMAKSTTNKKWTDDKLDDVKVSDALLATGQGLWDMWMAQKLKTCWRCNCSCAGGVCKKSQKALITNYHYGHKYLSVILGDIVWSAKGCMGQALWTFWMQDIKKEQYFRIKMREGTSMEAHLKHMKEILDKLAAIGAPSAEEDQIVMLLGTYQRVTLLWWQHWKLVLVMSSWVLLNKLLFMKSRNQMENLVICHQLHASIGCGTSGRTKQR